MRKLFAAVAVALLTAAGLVSMTLPAQAANLLTNPGFESGSLAGWSCSGNLGSVVGSPVRSGSFALQGAASSADNAKCTQTVSVVPNTTYTLSAWVRGNYVHLGVTGGPIAWTPAAAAYTELRASFTSGAGQTSAQVFLHGWYGTGAYNADDVSLDGPGGGPTVPGAPGTPTIGTVTNTSIALSWAGSSGTVTGYRVYEGTTRIRDNLTATSVTITGLATCSTHTYTVAAFNSAGESPRSGPVTGNTSGCGTGVPGVPGTPVVGTPTNTSIPLSWAASSGTVTGYRVYEGNTRVRDNLTTTSVTITGLGQCTSHTYTIAAFNTAGESQRSAPVTGLTTGCGTAIPGTPGTPTVGTVTNTSIALSWGGSSGNVTGYRVYEGNTRVRDNLATTSVTITGLATCSSHTYTIAAFNASGESPRSGPASATTTGCPNTGLPRHALIGYMHASFANGSGYVRMADIPMAWDIINLAFGEPTSVTSGDIRFTRCPVSECPSVESEADFIAAIRAKQAQGKKILISIGGQNGVVQLSSTAARDRFVSSVSAIIDRYGLDGLDIDFEGHSLSLNTGDTDFRNPTTPVVVNLISALRTLKARYGARFVLTMAPETFFVQLGYQFYGSGPFGGQDPRAGVYLPVIHAVRDFLTVLHVQDYNSGPIMGLDNSFHNIGNADFHIAMTDMLKAGFPVAGNVNNRFPGLREDQIAFGVPAGVSAGNGYTSPAQIQQAVNCLARGTNCGGYTLRGGASPAFRGLMTWSINWDRFFGYEFMNSHEPFLNGLP